MCRTFESLLVEDVIKDMKERMLDKDLARIFENAFPNTLDTTVRWHIDSSHKRKTRKWGSLSYSSPDDDKWQGAQSFIVTGDINAEWLRDSTNQLAQYQPLAKKDKAIYELILGAINTQAEYVIGSPYCNAFQPPPPSGLDPTFGGGEDEVHPIYEPSFVFECKYELDSLAAFLSLGNQFWEHTASTEFLTSRWFEALNTLLGVLDAQAKPTFNDEDGYERNDYTFQRRTNTGTETLNLAGIGNPLNGGTGLIRSAFRPSDDATILGFFIPANAMIAVELKRTASVLEKAGKKKKLAQNLRHRAKTIEDGIWEHGVIEHKKFGKVFAYEVDGYGSHILMDDANLPSLLSLPLLGFVSSSDQTYQNTRQMILSKQGNPYFLRGLDFKGIGGPHIGVKNAWPMSVLVQAMTSEDDREISGCLERVKNVSQLGLIHESVNVQFGRDYTRK